MLKSPALRISIIYIIFGVLWIWKSDQFLAALVADVEQFTIWSMYKGWGYVAITAALIFWLVRRYFRRLLVLQERYRKKEAEFRLYIEKLPVGAFRSFANEEGRFVLVNHVMVTLSGCVSASDLQHRNLVDFFEQRSEYQRLLHKLMQQRKIVSEPVQFRRLDGMRLDLALTASLHRDETGQYYIDGVGVDETDRRRNEGELRLLWRALNQTTEAIILTDNEFRVTYVNPGFEQITGYSGEIILGKPIGVLRSREYDGDFYRAVQETIERGETWHGAIRGGRRNGEVYEANVTASPVLNAEHIITHYVFIGCDVSHEMQLDRQLRQAQKMEAIGRMAGGIAHDFNNILTAILGFADLAQQDLESGHAAHKDLEEILRASRRAKEIVKRILIFSRQAQHQPALTNGAKIVEEVLVLLYSAIPSNIKIHTHIDPSCPPIAIDATELHQVIMNLATNACQAMEKKGGELFIAFRPNPCGSAKECVCLSVRDTGDGMDREVLQNIFDPYFTTKGVGQGTGLGLATVHAIVENSGGVIHVDSKVGRGTVFEICFPVATITETDEAVASTPVSGKGREILLVDDETAVLNVMRRQLERAHYKVSAFSDPKEAIACLASRCGGFSAMVTDFTMPNMSGIELTGHCRKLCPDLPVLLITGYGNQTVQEAALEAGINRVLTKPLAATELSQEVGKMLHDMEDHPCTV